MGLLDGKVGIVTGAAQGLGLAVAELAVHLAERLHQGVDVRHAGTREARRRRSVRPSR